MKINTTGYFKRFERTHQTYQLHQMHSIDPTIDMVPTHALDPNLVFPNILKEAEIEGIGTLYVTRGSFEKIMRLRGEGFELMSICDYANMLIEINKIRHGGFEELLELMTLYPEKFQEMEEDDRDLLTQLCSGVMDIENHEGPFDYEYSGSFVKDSIIYRPSGDGSIIPPIISDDPLLFMAAKDSLPEGELYLDSKFLEGYLRYKYSELYPQIKEITDYENFLDLDNHYEHQIDPWEIGHDQVGNWAFRGIGIPEYTSNYVSRFGSFLRILGIPSMAYFLHPDYVNDEKHEGRAFCRQIYFTGTDIDCGVNYPYKFEGQVRLLKKNEDLLYSSQRTYRSAIC